MGGRGTSTADGESIVFYSDDEVVASTNPGWIQQAFDLLTGLFDQVGLQTIVHKTVGVVYRTFRVARVRADKAYTQMMAGERRIFKERQR